MKKTFKDPEVKVIRVDENDVICTSGCGYGEHDNELSVDMLP